MSYQMTIEEARVASDKYGSAYAKGFIEGHESRNAEVEELKELNHRLEIRDAAWRSAVYDDGLRPLAVKGGGDILEVTPKRLTDLLDENNELKKKISEFEDQKIADVQSSPLEESK